VTSGNFSPTLRRGIALGFLPPTVEIGTAVTIDVRGRPVPATVVRPPFVPRRCPGDRSRPSVRVLHARGGGTALGRPPASTRRAERLVQALAPSSP